MIPLKQCFQTGLLLAATALSTRAGTFFSDFNSGALPAGTHTNVGGSGGAYLELTGGVGDSGCFKICKSVNSQNGSIVLDDLDSGSPIYGFDITFDVRIGGGTGTPADGFALVVAPDISDTSIWGETGTGSGLRFTWGIYTGSGQNPPDPAIRIRVGPGGGIVAYKGYTVTGMRTGGTDPSNWWQPVHIRLNPDGSLTFDFKGANVFTNFFIPGYQDLVNAGVPVRFGMSGRTGGLNENFWIDNLSITTFTTPMVGISQQPFSQTVQQGDNASFDARVANTNGVSYQWYSNAFSIAGATGRTLVVSNVQPGFSGTTYKAVAIGPNNSATSSVVTLTVTNIGIPTPQISFNFDDGLVPGNTTATGNATVSPTGGINNSGCLHLTDAVNGESGALIVADPNAGAPVYGLTARFKSLVGGGTAPPADGFAFAFGNDIPAIPAGEFDNGGGLGTGLVVSFDIFDNVGIFGYQGANGAEPSIAVRYGGQLIAQSQKLPLSFMETGVNPDGSPAFDDTIIQLNVEGTVTVVHRGALVFNRLPVPGFGSIAGGSYALAARTGGLNENHWVDNFDLTTVTTPGAVRITSQTGNQSILVNHLMTNSVSVNDTTGVTYQWYRGGSAVGGATGSAYVLSVVTGDSGAVFSAVASKSSVTVTSAPATLTVVNLVPPASPQFSYNFNDGLVPVSTANIYGNASVTATGGVGDSGVLHLTDNANGQNSAFVVSNQVFNGAQVSAISVAFDVREGGGSGNPADGFSFNWAAGLTDGTVGNAETGTGNGVSLAFRRYTGGGNSDNPPSPYIGIKYKGNFIATTQIPGAQLDTDVGATPAFRTMLFRVDPDGKAYLAYGERVLYNGLQLPNYTFTANSKFGFYGRTGGENNNQWFDNVKIQATQSSGPLAIATQPANALVIVGQTATFTVSLSDPNGATYQWSKNGSTIGGATASSYTTPATTLGDNGALFRVSASGPSGSATSSNALLTVVAPITVSSPTRIYDFNDCLTPADTTINGSTSIACDGGITNSGVLHLTDAVNSQQGSFVMPDLNNGAAIKALTVVMSLRIAEGSGTPADGFAFCWGSSNSIPDGANFGEGGQGDGLCVGLITYAGRPDGPAFYVSYHNTQLINKIVPYSALSTADLSGDPLLQYATLAIRVNENGTLDLQYKGNAIFAGLPLPGYAATAGGRFAVGARTGGENETHWVDNLALATTVGLVPVRLNFSRVGSDLRLTWAGDGFKLQSTPSLSAPISWTTVSTTSPYQTPITGASRFFRLAPAP